MEYILVVNNLIALYVLYLGCRKFQYFYDIRFVIIVAWYLNFGLRPLFYDEQLLIFHWFNFDAVEYMFSIAFSYIFVSFMFLFCGRNVRVVYQNSFFISRAAQILLFIMVIIGASVALIQTESNGGVYENRILANQNAVGNGIATFIRMIPFAALSLMAYTETNRYLILAGAACLLPSSVLIGSRNDTLSLLIILGYCYRDRISAKMTVAILGIAAVVMYLMYGMKEQLLIVDGPFDNFMLILNNSTMTFDGSEWFAQALKLPALNLGIIPYFESIMYTYIPRALWEGKPVVYGQAVSEYYLSMREIPIEPFTGTFPVGLMAENFESFNIFFILILPLFMRILNNIIRLILCTRNLIAAAVGAAYLLSLNNPIVVSRSFSDALSLFLFYIILNYFLIFASTRKIGFKK